MPTLIKARSTWTLSAERCPREILDLTVDGWTGPQLAERMSVSEETLHALRWDAMHKFEARAARDIARALRQADLGD